MSWKDRWIAFDTETTGFGPSARIIEAGIVTFEGGEVVDVWSSLFLPKDVDWSHPKVQEALAVNQITVADLQGQPAFEDVFADVYLRFTSAPTWVAHNAQFDEDMFSQESSRVGVHDFPLDSCICLDTMHLSYKLEPQAFGFKLAEVAKRWGVVPDGLHRASSDALTCGAVLASMVKHLPEDLEELHVIRRQAIEGWKCRPRRR